MENIKSGDLIKARFNTYTINRDSLKLIKNKYYKIYNIVIHSSGDVQFNVCVEGNYIDEYNFDDLRKTFILPDEFDETEIGGPRNIIVSNTESKPIPTIDHLMEDIRVHGDIIDNMSNELRQLNEFLITIRDEINPSW